MRKASSVFMLACGFAVIAVYGGRYFLHYSSMTQADYLKANWVGYGIGWAVLIAGYLLYPLKGPK